ncbi:Hypothetical predicted protein [Olea europaea subsp. europaea]|uniref:Uncharacterized protein n=1 Tax=Olea europaea subsp. europaea TaxID=158383 RepID=A0A8S0TB30_OLEEU|nr:Hypothetical predicted protein [Olea europaea subsp. europaea]
MDWIEFLTTESTTLKSSNVGPQCLEAEKLVSRPILDLKYSKRKGAPKKLRRKGHLESSSKKSKGSTSVATNSSTSRMPVSNDSMSVYLKEVQTTTTFPCVTRHNLGTQESIVDNQ